MDTLYFDNAATTCLHEEVIQAMNASMRECYGNPSSTHAFGRAAKARIESARKMIATELGVTPNEIFFTSCGTESNNLVIRSAVHHLGVKRIITSPLEHKCVLETTLDVAKKFHVQVEMVKVLPNGDIDLMHLQQLLSSSETPTLVTLMHANNEIGNLTPVSEISTMCKEYRAFFHSDTVQTIGHYTLNLKELGLDFASASAHKFHGPKGAGFVYINKSIGAQAAITGGGQERNHRSGTENTYGIVGQAKAFELAYRDLEVHKNHILGLKAYAIQAFKEQVPDLRFNGRSAEIQESLYTVLSISLPYRDPMIGFELELKGIAVSQGSACSSGAAKVSNVIAALYSESELEQLTPLRISFSQFNTQQEVDVLVKTIGEMCAKKRKASA